MRQYCRYCFHAVAYEDEWYWCEQKNECYHMKKSKRVNRCKQFEFNENDLWRCDENGNFEVYKPRGEYRKHVHEVMENYSLFDQEDGNGTL